MQLLTLSLKHLNNSLQVGDMIYATPTTKQDGAEDLENTAGHTGRGKLVGILLDIAIVDGKTVLTVDDSLPTEIVGPRYQVQANDFIMFSKYSQTDGDVSGYYAKANFVNNSTEKAELFAVSSEIIINSK
tara:strand:- start:423 stop:812 length:390 start_codon:yes stop_codon:yes gene_type:complete